MKKMENQKGQQRPPALKVLLRMISLQNIVIFQVLKAWWDDKDDKATNHCLNILGVMTKPWAPNITMFCSEVIMIKTFKPIKSIGHTF